MMRTPRVKRRAIYFRTRNTNEKENSQNVHMQLIAKKKSQRKEMTPIKKRERPENRSSGKLKFLRVYVT